MKPPFWQSVWFWIPVLLAARRRHWRWSGGASSPHAPPDRAAAAGTYGRERAAAHREDLHDDLGAGSLISLVSAMAERAASPARVPAVEGFPTLARELVSALYETVWSVNPENDRHQFARQFPLPACAEALRSGGDTVRIRACDVRTTLSRTNCGTM